MCVRMCLCVIGIARVCTFKGMLHPTCEFGKSFPNGISSALWLNERWHQIKRDHKMINDIKQDKSSIAWFVIAVLVENLRKNNKKSPQNIVRMLLLLYRHHNHLSNDEALKIKHIPNAQRSERRMLVHIFTRFGKQEEVVLGNLKFLAKPGSLFWLSINPTSNAVRLDRPDKQSNPRAAKTHKLTICSIRSTGLFTPTFKPYRCRNHLHKYTLKKKTQGS